MARTPSTFDPPKTPVLPPETPALEKTPVTAVARTPSTFDPPKTPVLPPETPALEKTPAGPEGTPPTFDLAKTPAPEPAGLEETPQGGSVDCPEPAATVASSDDAVPSGSDGSHQASGVGSAGSAAVPEGQQGPSYSESSPLTVVNRSGDPSDSPQGTLPQSQLLPETGRTSSSLPILFGLFGGGILLTGGTLELLRRQQRSQLRQR